jgi:porphobilinogen synthase
MVDRSSARLRRLRSSAAVRGLVRETHVSPEQLVLPLFVAEGLSDPRPVPSMPGVVQHTRDSLRKAVAEAASLGIGGVMLFGVPQHKDARGSGALDPDGILNVAIADAASEAGSSLLVMSDVCLDEFTDHGHCGLIDDAGNILNDETVEIYAQMAVLHAECGADFVGPSGMMDGQVRAIRAALDSGGATGVGILAYSAKFTSFAYGPFRDAVNSSLVGDRAMYQLDPANAREAVRQARMDAWDGADIVMVKPALGFLDIVAKVRDAVDIPVAAYNVSGEYAMVEAAAERGWIDRDRAITESVLSIRRAGADIVLTYWAAELARQIRS